MFFIGEGGGGGSLVKFLQTEEDQTCFLCSQGRVTLFLARKNYSMSLLLKTTLLFVNKHAKSL